MTTNSASSDGERFSLRSELSELVSIPAWVEHLASLHAIPANTQFAINLCLEEALSNIIRHGYGSKPGHSIGVHFTSPHNGYVVFVIEDQAPLFNPLNVAEPPAARSIEEARVGGQGVRLMRQFADAVDYKPIPTGNRLTIGFAFSGPEPPSK